MPRSIGERDHTPDYPLPGTNPEFEADERCRNTRYAREEHFGLDRHRSSSGRYSPEQRSRSRSNRRGGDDRRRQHVTSSSHGQARRTYGHRHSRRSQDWDCEQRSSARYSQERRSRSRSRGEDRRHYHETSSEARHRRGHRHTSGSQDAARIQPSISRYAFATDSSPIPLLSSPYYLSTVRPQIANSASSALPLARDAQPTPSLLQIASSSAANLPALSQPTLEVLEACRNQIMAEFIAKMELQVKAKEEFAQKIAEEEMKKMAKTIRKEEKKKRKAYRRLMKEEVALIDARSKNFEMKKEKERQQCELKCRILSLKNQKLEEEKAELEKDAKSTNKDRRSKSI